MSDSLKTITVVMRCLNTESDGAPIYENGRYIITDEKKRRPVEKFCPSDVESGNRAAVYQYKSLARDKWFVVKRWPATA